jgi:hypothetical protein
MYIAMTVEIQVVEEYVKNLAEDSQSIGTTREMKDPGSSIMQDSRRVVLATLPTTTLSPTSPRLIRAIIPIPISSAVPWFSLVVWASILPVIGTVIIRIRIDDITPLEGAQYP